LRAEAELQKAGNQAGPRLLAALKKADVLESRQRLAQLLDHIDKAAPSDEVLRSIRALEYISSREAAALIRQLAGGTAGLRATEEAKFTLRRIGR
jgi:hypothetical protein